LLTHGHADHAGSALALADKWDVMIYAHHLELPYLSGKSLYPPADPTVGGAIAFLSRFFPRRTHHLGKRLHELPHGKVPGLTGWEWIASPGHSPGQVAFFRESDCVLLAGDAFATVDLDSWSGLFAGGQRFAPPPSPFTYDWHATRASIAALAKLRPNVVGCGHGVPISDCDLSDRLADFAARFNPPRRGRYVREPARADENGIVDLPPAPFDPVPFATLGALLLVGIALGAGYFDED
jgi:glyoxylase-like metal-dependent hydrolase (beta-lactamase superfamily II)